MTLSVREELDDLSPHTRLLYCFCLQGDMWKGLQHFSAPPELLWDEQRLYECSISLDGVLCAALGAKGNPLSVLLSFSVLQLTCPATSILGHLLVLGFIGSLSPSPSGDCSQ